MTSKAAFQNHPHPHVLPADADPQEEGSILPLEEYDYGPEWADLAEKVAARNNSDQQEAIADGGEVNTFECGATGCGETVEGYPDECPHCGAAYNWNI